MSVQNALSSPRLFASFHHASTLAGGFLQRLRDPGPAEGYRIMLDIDKIVTTATIFAGMLGRTGEELRMLPAGNSC